MQRLTPILLVSLLLAGCDLVGDIFQAGLVVGIIVVIVIIAILGWIVGKFRGRGGTGA